MVSKATPQGWYVACLGTDLQHKPLSRVVWGRPLVLFRDADGLPKALHDRCPHRHAALSQGRIDHGQIACPYHGWRFSGDGKCTHIPGLERTTDKENRTVPSLCTVESDGFIWVWSAPGEPTESPLVRWSGERGWTRFYGSGPMVGSLFDVIENFLDPMHTHFVHNRLVRSGAKRVATKVNIRHVPRGVRADYVDEARQSGLISRLLGRGIDRTQGSFDLPSTAALTYLSKDATRLQIVLHFTPTDSNHVMAFALVMGKVPRALRPVLVPLVKVLFRAVFRQDQQILAQRQANADRHADAPPYVFSQADLLGPAIRKLLHDQATTVGTPRTVTVHL